MHMNQKADAKIWRFWVDSKLIATFFLYLLRPNGGTATIWTYSLNLCRKSNRNQVGYDGWRAYGSLIIPKVGLFLLLIAIYCSIRGEYWEISAEYWKVSLRKNLHPSHFCRKSLCAKGFRNVRDLKYPSHIPHTSLTSTLWLFLKYSYNIKDRLKRANLFPY